MGVPERTEVRRNHAHRRFVRDLNDRRIVAGRGEPDRGVRQAQRTAKLRLMPLLDRRGRQIELEQLVLAGDATELTGSMVSSRVSGNAATAGRALREIVAVSEADAIVASLGRHNGDRDAAAAELNISRSYLDARSAALGLR